MVKFLLALAAVIVPLYGAEKSYTPDEVGRHNKKSDCWLIIDTGVYNVTGYLERHRDFDYDITKHCGSNASEFWRKKPGTGEAHSRKAERLLGRYKIGALGQ